MRNSKALFWLETCYIQVLLQNTRTSCSRELSGHVFGIMSFLSSLTVILFFVSDASFCLLGPLLSVSQAPAMGLPKCSVNHPGEVGSRFTPTQAHDCCLLSPDGLPTQARGPVGGWAPDFCFRAWSLQSPQAEMGSSGGREGYRGTCRKGSEAAPWGPEACPWLQSRVSPLCLTCFKAPPGPVGPGFLVFPRPSCRNCRWSVLW